jgi:hypothetical protein
VKLLLIAVAVQDAPAELGRVAWQREFDLAEARAKQEKRLLLLLFQEVPG